MSQCIIFTGLEISDHSLYRPAGAYRIRTELEANGFSCQVIDFWHHFSKDEIEVILKKFVDNNTIWIGFSTTFMNTSTEIKEDLEFWNNIKQKYHWVKFISGGAKSLVEEMDFIDFYVTGYADSAIVELTKNISLFTDKIIDSNKDYNKKDLTNIPIVWKQEDYIPKGSALPMEIARGCIFNCAFCNFPMNNKKKLDYIREAQSIADELTYNYENFGVTDYWFMDDTFNDSIQKLEVLHSVITKLPFKISYSTYIKPELLVAQPDQIPLLIESGLRCAAYGIESLNPDTRQAIYKMKDPDKVLGALQDIKTQSNGTVSNQCTFIVGLPYESIDSVYKSNERIYNCDFIDQFSWYPLNIHTPDKYAYTSPIDRNPLSFGYITKHRPIITNTVAGKTNGASMEWINEHMNSKKAAAIATELNAKNRDRQKIYVWYRESLLTLGFDVDNHWKEHNGLLSKLPINLLAKHKKEFINNYKRTLNDINK
jgi:hypothetical protein